MSIDAKFLTGSTLRHIVVMSCSGAMGIMTIFLVDLLDIFFLSLLGNEALTAAAGYATTITYITTSIAIGLSIACGALVARAVGQRQREKASRLLVNVALVTLAISLVTAALLVNLVPTLLSLLGAEGEAAQLAAQYLYIMLPSMPFIVLAMAAGAALRAVGDARLSATSIMAGGLVNAVLDPLFIFGLDLSIEGAAYASVLARVTVLILAGRAVFYKHGLIRWHGWATLRADLAGIMQIAVPAMATNVATPVANAVLVRSLAEYGNGYVAGLAVIARLSPVAFALVYASSGAIGPIVGQNFGAGLLDRVKSSLVNALFFCSAYVLVVSALLLLLRDPIISAFGLDQEGASLVYFFCTFLAFSFLFNGSQYVANAAFNNLGKPTYSTLFNWGKATLGTIPFVYVGGHFFGAYGVLAGQSLGSIIFGSLAVWCAFRLLAKQQRQQAEKASRAA